MAAVFIENPGAAAKPSRVAERSVEASGVPSRIEGGDVVGILGLQVAGPGVLGVNRIVQITSRLEVNRGDEHGRVRVLRRSIGAGTVAGQGENVGSIAQRDADRSEERRVGKKRRSRWLP